jgi:hypothetical protein
MKTSISYAERMLICVVIAAAGQALAAQSASAQQLEVGARAGVSVDPDQF